MKHALRTLALITMVCAAAVGQNAQQPAQDENGRLEREYVAANEKRRQLQAYILQPILKCYPNTLTPAQEARMDADYQIYEARLAQVTLQELTPILLRDGQSATLDDFLKRTHLADLVAIWRKGRCK